MLQSTKDLRQYTQRWCQKCHGGTVTKRTERNHRDHPRATNAPSGQCEQGSSTTRAHSTIRDTQERNEMDDRSGKRRRFEELSQVCFPFLILMNSH